MRNFNNRPPKFDPSKGNQKRQVARAFYEKPRTCTMVEYATGIAPKNIDRFIAEMLKSGTLFEVRKGICEITKVSGVKYYSNNQKYYPKHLPKQLKLYDNINL